MLNLHHKKLFVAASVFFICLFFLNVKVNAHQAIQQQLEQLELQIKAQPSKHSLYLKRASFWILDKQFKRALIDINTAEKFGATSNVLYYKGLLFSSWKQPEKALHYLNPFIQQQPNNIAALKARANVYINMGKTHAALGDYQHILKHTPYPNPGLFMATASLALKINNTKMALSIIDQGINQLGLISQLQQFAIDLESQNQRYQNAEDRIKSLVLSMPLNPSYPIQLAELFILTANFSQAQKQLNKAESILAKQKVTPWKIKIEQQIQTLRTKIFCQNKDGACVDS